MKRILLVSAMMTGLAWPVLGQELPRRLGGANGPPPADAAPNRPVPKLPDGTVDLSGVWTDGGSAAIGRLLKPGELDSLLQPWAKKLMESRKPEDDPHAHCMPMGIPRQAGGYPWRFVQYRNSHIFVHCLSAVPWSQWQ